MKLMECHLNHVGNRIRRALVNSTFYIVLAGPNPEDQCELAFMSN